MEIYNFKITKQVKENLDFILKNKKERVELEENLKAEFFRERNDLDPNLYTVEISFNKTANTYDILLKNI